MSVPLGVLVYFLIKWLVMLDNGGFFDLDCTSNIGNFAQQNGTKLGKVGQNWQKLRYVWKILKNAKPKYSFFAWLLYHESKHTLKFQNLLEIYQKTSTKTGIC